MDDVNLLFAYALRQNYSTLVQLKRPRTDYMEKRESRVAKLQTNQWKTKFKLSRTCPIFKEVIIIFWPLSNLFVFSLLNFIDLFFSVMIRLPAKHENRTEEKCTFIILRDCCFCTCKSRLYLESEMFARGFNVAWVQNEFIHVCFTFHILQYFQLVSDFTFELLFLGALFSFWL